MARYFVQALNQWCIRLPLTCNQELLPILANDPVWASPGKKKPLARAPRGLRRRLDLARTSLLGVSTAPRLTFGRFDQEFPAVFAVDPVRWLVMACLAGELLELDPERLLQGGWHGQALLALWVEPQHFGFDRRCATASRDAGAGGVGLPVG